MSTFGLALFDTTVGRCGIAWGPRGLTGLALPGGGDDEVRARLSRRGTLVPDDVPPPHVQRTIDGIVALLQGEAVDLSQAELDMAGVSSFDARVYEVARTIAPGATLRYGEVAARLGDPGLARAVGRALGRNPFPLVVPCHRVVAAGGRTGGFSAPGGARTKLRLLEIERSKERTELSLFEAQWHPGPSTSPGSQSSNPQPGPAISNQEPARPSVGP